MRLTRWLTGGMLLFLGALNALLSWKAATCTQASADSLYGVIVTAPLYLLGWLAIPKREVNGLVVIMVSSVSIIVMAFVTAWTVSLALGAPACRLMTGLPFDYDGREQIFAALWGGTCILFWGGLGFALKSTNWVRDIPIEHD